MSYIFVQALINMKDKDCICGSRLVSSIQPSIKQGWGTRGALGDAASTPPPSQPRDLCPKQLRIVDWDRPSDVP
jgi:hypothetical protein